MAQVTGPNPVARYFEGHGNEVLSITKAEHFVTKYTNAEGKESMALLLIFGETDYGKGGKLEDRMMGIWVLANLEQLQNQLRQAPKEIAKKLIAKLEEKGYAREGKLVTSEAGPSAPLPDVGGVFEGLESEEEKAG